MSGLPLRKEPVCLNCNTSIEGRFCHYCGQENTEPHESVISLAKYFIFDQLQYDGKFFTSLKLLLLRPGLLSQEYVQGRRA